MCEEVRRDQRKNILMNLIISPEIYYLLQKNCDMKPYFLSEIPLVKIKKDHKEKLEKLGKDKHYSAMYPIFSEIKQLEWKPIEEKRESI